MERVEKGTYLGKLLKTHGTRGDLIWQHGFHSNIDLPSWEAIMVELHEQSFIPFFIENIKSQDETHFIIKLEEIDSKEIAADLVGKNVYASPTIKMNVHDLKMSSRNYIGFQLWHKNNFLGEIIDFIQQGQALFLINYNQKEIFIPAHEDFIIEENHDKKQIHVNLPDGLLDL